MPRTSLATAVYDTPQKSARTSGVGFIVIHHGALTSLDELIRLMMGAKQVSAHLAVKDADIVSMMDETYRAWSMSDAAWDSKSLTVETCNSGGAADGWPISEASYRSLARVVADWCTRHSIPCTRDYVVGHGEVYSRFGGSYSTACPGGIDLDRVVSDARAILSPAPTVQEDDMAYKYIWNGVSAPNAGARYALIGVDLDGGYVESSKVADAKGFSGMSPMPGAPHQLDAEGFESTLRMARKAREDYLKSRATIGEVTVTGDPEVRRLLGELLAAVAAPRTTTVG